MIVLFVLRKPRVSPDFRHNGNIKNVTPRSHHASPKTIHMMEVAAVSFTLWSHIAHETKSKFEILSLRAITALCN